MRAVYVNFKYHSVSLPRCGYFTASMFPCTVRNEADCQCLKACWRSFRKCFLPVSNCCYMSLLLSFNELLCRENETKTKSGRWGSSKSPDRNFCWGFPSVLPFVRWLCFPVFQRITNKVPSITEKKKKESNQRHYTVWRSNDDVISGGPLLLAAVDVLPEVHYL